MAIKRFKRDNFGNGIHSEFFIDSADDLEVIEDIYDCELGDRAFTPTGTEYIRHSDDFDGDLWVLVSKQGDSDGSGEGSDSSGSGLVVRVIQDEQTLKYTLDKTYAEIYEAFSMGRMVVLAGETSLSAITSADNTSCKVEFGSDSFVANSSDDYPTVDEK